MDIEEIVRKRASPGILIYDWDHLLLYANEESMGLIPELRTKKPSCSARLKIRQLCEAVVRKGEADNKTSCCYVRSDNSGHPFYLYLRAFPIYKSSSRSARHIMVLIEKVIVRHEVNYEEVKAKYGITNRENEVLKLICDGLTNKELADKLSIQECTVKDHIKKIMRKMGVQSRTSIMNLLQNM